MCSSDLDRSVQGETVTADQTHLHPGLYETFDGVQGLAFSASPGSFGVDLQYAHGVAASPR